MSTIQTADLNGVSFTSFIYSQETKQWEASGQLTEVLDSLQVVAKNISALVRFAGVDASFRMTDREKNISQFVNTANDIFLSVLFETESIGVLVSKAPGKVIDKLKERKGKYIVCYDPLNGATNLDYSIPVASIFLVMVKESQDIPFVADITSIHNKIVAAGYMLYGGYTTFVFSTRGEVHGFALDPELGEFFLSDRNMKIPKKGNIYSIHEGDASFWEEGLTSYVSEKKNPKKGKPFTARYTGSLVADIHRIMVLGGIYMSPDIKQRKEGLAMLCECKPLAFLVYQAGGAATNGVSPILNVKVNEIHEMSAMYIGSKEDVEDITQTLVKYRTDTLLN